MRHGAVALIALGLAGCAPAYTMLVPRPPLKYEKLGQAEGVGCGTGWIVLVPFRPESISVGYEGRLERARNNAIASVPGATALTHLEIRQTLVWYLIGWTDCITVRGEAIR